jgi:hypothetical protein
MQGTVSTLLLITSAVALGCFVVDYALIVTDQALQPQNNSQIDRIRDLSDKLVNQTNWLFNQTQIAIPNQPSP